MELAANVWPVVDGATGIVMRYFMRAYAIDADDKTISQTLRALAPTDFRSHRVLSGKWVRGSDSAHLSFSIMPVSTILVADEQEMSCES